MFKYSNVQTNINFIFDTCFLFEGISNSLHTVVRKFKSVFFMFLNGFF